MEMGGGGGKTRRTFFERAEGNSLEGVGRPTQSEVTWVEGGEGV